MAWLQYKDGWVPNRRGLERDPEYHQVVQPDLWQPCHVRFKQRRIGTLLKQFEPTGSWHRAYSRPTADNRIIVSEASDTNELTTDPQLGSDLLFAAQPYEVVNGH